MEIRSSNLLMVGRWVMFAEIIGSVEAALSPVHVKFIIGLALADHAVANPVEMRVMFHRLSVIGTGAYPFGTRKAVSLSLAILPAWGGPTFLFGFRRKHDCDAGGES
jgi:hypothetical protein